MAEEQKAGWRPGSGKKYDPNDPHFNPRHPPEDCPQDALWQEWFGKDWEKAKAEWEQEQREKQAKSE